MTNALPRGTASSTDWLAVSFHSKILKPKQIGAHIYYCISYWLGSITRLARFTKTLKSALRSLGSHLHIQRRDKQSYLTRSVHPRGPFAFQSDACSATSMQQKPLNINADCADAICASAFTFCKQNKTSSMFICASSILLIILSSKYRLILQTDVEKQLASFQAKFCSVPKVCPRLRLSPFRVRQKWQNGEQERAGYSVCM